MCLPYKDLLVYLSDLHVSEIRSLPPDTELFLSLCMSLYLDLKGIKDRGDGAGAEVTGSCVC